jgi:hypothetical protein
MQHILGSAGMCIYLSANVVTLLFMLDIRVHILFTSILDGRIPPQFSKLNTVIPLSIRSILLAFYHVVHVDTRNVLLA